MEIVTENGAWVVRAEWHGEVRTVFRGWTPENPEAMEDSMCAMTSLQDCISFRKEHSGTCT